MLRRFLSFFRTGIPSWHLAFLFIIAAVAVDVLLIRLMSHQALVDQEVSVTLELSSYRTRIEERLNSNLFLVDGLAAHISILPEISGDEFEAIAQILLGRSTSIKRIAAAPDFVIQYVYPRNNSEAFKGLDFRSIPEFRPQVLAAKETHRMTAAGPMDFADEGKVLMAWIPVFSQADGEFWGVVAMEIDLDKLVEHTGFYLANTGLNVAIFGQDKKGERGEMIWGDPELFEKKAKTVGMTISLPSGYWRIAGIPKTGWNTHSPYAWLIHLCVFLIAGITAFSRIQQHRSKVALMESADRIKAMSVASLDALIMIDSQDNITFWNPAAESMFGYAMDVMLGQKLHNIIAPLQEREKAREGLTHFTKSGEGAVLSRVVELTAVRKSGEEFPAELAVAPLHFGGKWYAVGSIRDITARKEAEKQLTLLATTDALTGLLNRRRFLELAEMEFKRAHRYQKSFCLMMFDLDFFKTINDSYGHDSGDQVLKTVAELVAHQLRNTDVIGRIGGEEFAVIMPETEIETAKLVSERIRLKFMETKMNLYAGTITLTVSIGIAQMDATAKAFSDLMKKADEALYEAKRTGRNRVVAAE